MQVMQHWHLNHFVPNNPPNPKDSASSIYKSCCYDVFEMCLNNMDFSLKCSMNNDQAAKSCLLSLARSMWSCDCTIPLERCMSRLKTVRPNITTRHANFSSPIKDWCSLRQTLRLYFTASTFFNSTNLFSGSLISIAIVSVSIPKKTTFVFAYKVFFSLKKTSKLLQINL